MITRIAEKFNLKKEDVEAVFTAVQEEKMEEMKNRRDERLSQAVEDGVITEAQKELLKSKFDAVRLEKRATRQEMEKWFSDNGIDADKIKNYLIFKTKGHGKMLSR